MKLHPPKKYTRLEFGPDDLSIPVSALLFDGVDEHASPLFHRHLKGQLAISLHGEVTCRVLGGDWIVPARCGVWIPHGVLHRSFLSSNGQMCMLFVDPAIASMPTQCCFLPLTPMQVEMALHLAHLPQQDLTTERVGKLVSVLLDELSAISPEQDFLPIPEDARLRLVADALMEKPADRAVVADWARRLAMSERNFTRLVKDKLGMSFGAWRQQIHIIQAQRWLAEKVSVKRIAADLGYDSPSSFIAMFKKATGCSPARYMERRSQHAMDELVVAAEPETQTARRHPALVATGSSLDGSDGVGGSGQTFVGLGKPTATRPD